jgi:hypothetical protein
MNWGLRASAAVKVDDKKMAVASVDPSLFNNAHPDLVVPALSPGDTIQIDGLRDKRLAFALPRTLVRLQIDVAAQVAEVVGRIDGVFLWADAGKLVITQRATFSYEFRPREVRRVTATAVAV